MSQPLRLITQTESWKQEVQVDVVTRLRELLAMAEAGELQGIAYAAATTDNMIATGFTKNNAQSAIIGGLARVTHRMLAGED
ncbi:hypothetical protein [Paradevosia shaoguanensis]|uniref:hypothetical protein n=1 Tax=Paradevosia shaoguanensis TaxID=1335043 RepID=UPI0019320586|nr:hypothetical protein [Paradevosia shaoguanensis]